MAVLLRKTYENKYVSDKRNSVEVEENYGVESLDKVNTVQQL